MTGRRRNAAAIGAFLLGALGLLIVGVLGFGGARWFAERDRAVIYFDGSVSGLQVGAPVTFRGVPIGSVERIALRVDTDSYRALIPVFIELRPTDLIVDGSRRTSRLDAQIPELVARGLRATLELQSVVTGQLRVELHFVASVDVPPTQVGDGTVPEIPPVKSDLQQFRDRITELPVEDTLAATQNVLSRLEELARQMQTLTATADHEITAVSRSLHATAESVTRLT